MIDIEHLLRIPLVDIEGGFDLSPDGTRLAFAWNATGQWEIYELDLAASHPPQLVSVGPGGKFTPRYSPDGSRMAYLVDFDGGENFHIFVNECHAERSEASPLQAIDTLRTEKALALGHKTDHAQDLTPHIDFAIQRNFCWSPGGEHIAFLSNQSGPFCPYILSLKEGDASLLVDLGLPAWYVTWSPDGCYLAVTCEAKGQDHNIFIVPVDGSKAIPIADENGPINAQNPAWSPDGIKIAFHSDLPNGCYQIGLFDLYRHPITWLTNGSANHHAPAWSKDGTKLTYIQAQGASDKVIVHPLNGEARECHVDTGVHYKPHFTPDGKNVAFIFNNPRHPPDLWVLATESGEFCQLTDSLRRNSFSRLITTEVTTTDLIFPEEITYPSLDGTPVPALLFKSGNASENTPAVIIIHGGPGWHFQVEWNPLMIHLASLGWTVLAPNYRGSTGYGRDWQLANRLNLGGVDTDDVAAGVRYLLDQGIADPVRIAVPGRSHGGYLTMSCLTRYPELWCAGSAIVPFLNWFTAHQNSREDLQYWDLQNFGDPKDNYDLWHQASPFFFLDKVSAPVQLICGENDPRCPASESTQARDKLLELGKEVDFQLYQGEGHVFLKTENLVDAEVRRVKFLSEAFEE